MQSLPGNYEGAPSPITCQVKPVAAEPLQVLHVQRLCRNTWHDEGGLEFSTNVNYDCSTQARHTYQAGGSREACKSPSDISHAIMPCHCIMLGSCLLVMNAESSCSHAGSTAKILGSSLHSAGTTAWARNAPV